MLPSLQTLGFTKQLLGQKRTRHLTCSKGENDNHLYLNFSHAAWEEDLGECKTLINPPAPTTDFNTKDPSWKEIQFVIKAVRTSSALGPNDVPYLVHKRCPKLTHRLWKILRAFWRKGKVAQQWRFAGVWVPKEEKSTGIEQFRTISLLNVEARIFFSTVSCWLTENL